MSRRDNQFSFRVLDVSQCNRDTGLYPKPATCLYKLINSLTSLTHLDISSTNLAAQPSQQDWPDKERSLELLLLITLHFIYFELRTLELLSFND